MSIRFLAIDGFNLTRRIFEARKAETASDMPAVIEAVVKSGTRALETHNPTHAAIVFEHHDKTWRHLLYPEYKANRSPTPELLLNAVPEFVAEYEKLGITHCDVTSYEADDVIATIAAVVADHGGIATILSTDKTYLQLLRANILVFDHFGDKQLTRAYVEDRYQIRQEQYVDYLALVGDRSNNIPGVTGIGPKTAVELLRQYPSIDAMLLANPEDHKALGKLHADREAALRAQQLVSLKTDVELGVNLKSFRR